MRVSLGGVTIYGELSFRDRIVRGAIGGVLGAGIGFLLALRGIMTGFWGNSIVLIAASLLGGAIGSWLAFRRKKVGW